MIGHDKLHPEWIIIIVMYQLLVSYAYKAFLDVMFFLLDSV